MSVQWGAWHGVGMVASSEAVLSRMRRSGVSTVSPLAGLAALGAVLHSAGPAQVIALDFVETSLPFHQLRSPTHERPEARGAVSGGSSAFCVEDVLGEHRTPAVLCRLPPPRRRTTKQQLCERC